MGESGVSVASASGTSQDRGQSACGAWKVLDSLTIPDDVLSTYVEFAVSQLPRSGFNTEATPFAAGGVLTSASIPIMSGSAPTEIVTPLPLTTTTNPLVPGDTPTQTTPTVPASAAV